jgi:hypothetical protein
MKIPAEEIKTKEIAGETKDGRPVVYIETVGGLHAFFCKDEDGKISALGAAPHAAIAKFLAEKKEDIEWNEIKKSEEISLFDRLRDAIFMPSLPEPVGDENLFAVYDISKSEIEIMYSEELLSKNISEWALVRSLALTEPAVPLKYFSRRS